MNIECFVPKNKILKESIAYFYFFETVSNDFKIDFKVFPQLNIPVTLHLHANFKRAGATSTVFRDINNPYLAVCNGLLGGPLHAAIEGMQNRITIVFKPLGLNHFIPAPHKIVLLRDIQIFPYWKGPAYESFLSEFFKLQDRAAQLKVLENFLLSIYSPYDEYIVLNKAVQMIVDFDNPTSISEIASQLGLTERQLNRLFHSFISISPVQFKKIARFRKTVDAQEVKQGRGKLTDLAYSGHFFDQAHLVRNYKEMTGNNPTSFFKSTERAVDGNVLMEVKKTPDV